MFRSQPWECPLTPRSPCRRHPERCSTREEQGGDEAGHQSGQHRDRHGEAQHPAHPGRRLSAAPGARRRARGARELPRKQQPKPPPATDRTRPSARNGRTLPSNRHRVLDESAISRCLVGRPGDHQICKIGARDDEHEDSGQEEEPHGWPVDHRRRTPSPPPRRFPIPSHRVPPPGAAAPALPWPPWLGPGKYRFRDAVSPRRPGVSLASCSSWAEGGSGTNSWGCSCQANVRGITPTTTYPLPSRMMLRPRMPGSPPKRRLQRPWERMMTLGSPLLVVAARAPAPPARRAPGRRIPSPSGPAPVPHPRRRSRYSPWTDRQPRLRRRAVAARCPGSRWPKGAGSASTPSAYLGRRCEGRPGARAARTGVA